MVYRGHPWSVLPSSRASLYAEAVKFHPGVLPWMVLVCKVGVDLVWDKSGTLPRFNLVGVGFPLESVDMRVPNAGYAVVEQIVVPWRRDHKSAAVHTVPSRIDITPNPRSARWEI